MARERRESVRESCSMRLLVRAASLDWVLGSAADVDVEVGVGEEEEEDFELAALLLLEGDVVFAAVCLKPGVIMPVDRAVVAWVDAEGAMPPPAIFRLRSVL